MKILLTGSTGYLGKKLGLALTQRGHSLVCAVRSLEKAKELPFPAEHVLWKDMNKLEGIDAVAHLAGESIAGQRWDEERKKLLLESRTRTTRDVVSLLGKISATGKVKSFVSASAIGYYGDQGDKELTEDSPPANSFLADICRAWEQEVFSAESKAERVCVLRIGIVLGRHGGALKEMLPLFKRGVAGKLASGKQWMSWVHEDDMVALFIHALENSEMKGVFNAVAPNPVTNLEFTKTMGRLLGVPTIFAAPGFALKLALGEMADLLLSSTRVKAKIPQFHFNFPTLEQALRQIFQKVEGQHGLQTHEYVAEQWFPQKVEEIFPFFAEPKNLEKITPDFLHFKILSQSTKSTQKNAVFEYQLKLHGIPFLWRTKILDWKENHYFIDNQEKGPYSLWHHTHEFIPLAGGTLMRDRVLYRLPVGFIGDLAALWKVQGDVENIFAFRRKTIGSLFNK